LHKILSLLESEDVDVRTHPVKVLANLDLVAEGCYKHYLFLIHACYNRVYGLIPTHVVRMSTYFAMPLANAKIQESEGVQTAVTVF
jgi:hypothetical protein